VTKNFLKPTSARRPGGIISLQGGGIIQESLGAIIPLQTGGSFIGIGTPNNDRRLAAILAADVLGHARPIAWTRRGRGKATRLHNCPSTRAGTYTSGVGRPAWAQGRQKVGPGRYVGRANSPDAYAGQAKDVGLHRLLKGRSASSLLCGRPDCRPPSGRHRRLFVFFFDQKIGQSRVPDVCDFMPRVSSSRPMIAVWTFVGRASTFLIDNLHFAAGTAQEVTEQRRVGVSSQVRSETDRSLLSSRAAGLPTSQERDSSLLRQLPPCPRLQFHGRFSP
jgi:hypothetical protein